MSDNDVTKRTRALDARYAEGARQIAERARSDGTVRATHDTSVTVRHVEPQSPIIDWLREHGPGTAPVIAEAIGRDANVVNASLRKFEDQKHVRRVGVEPNPRGRARVIYALVGAELEDEDVTTVTQNANGATTDGAHGTTEEPVELVELRADDLEELLAGYCGSVTLAEADSSVLLFVLRMRRVQDKLREVEASS